MSVFFVADEMLGDVAKWLRIMGNEVRYKRGRPDSSLIELAKSGGILLTADADLHNRATRKGVVSILVTGDTIVDKLVMVFIEAGLRPRLEDTRCTVCGGKLRIAGKGDGKKTTWYCDDCGKVYWKGSHWKNIARTISSVERRIARQTK